MAPKPLTRWLGRSLPLLVMAAGILPNAAAQSPPTSASGQLEFTNLRPCSKEPGGQSLLYFIAAAYGLPEYLVYGPEWIRTECVHITAVQGRQPLYREGLHRELVSKFQLSAHVENRQEDVYVFRIPNDDTPLKMVRTDKPGGASLGNNAIEATGTPLPISLFEQRLRRPVFDETNLTGYFRFTLKWTGQDFFDAVKSQLGVELISTKRTIDVLVIDHVIPWPSDH